MTSQILYAAPLIPLLSALLILILSKILNERAVAHIMGWTVAIFGAALAYLLISLVQGGLKPLHSNALTLYTEGEYSFHFHLFFDALSAVYVALGGLLFSIVVRFSRYYVHREEGFLRFFVGLNLMLGGLVIIGLAANFETLFAGWEVFGIASFLLIAFYYKNPIAVRNAVIVYSVYRFSDIGLLATALLGQTVFDFSNIHNQVANIQGLSVALPIGFFLLLSAAGKSAQFPFSFWISRSMEGPTPSSAIFYGALGVHTGAFLLLRTYPIWQDQPIICVSVALVGLVTALFASMTSRLQHTIKAQIGYAAVAQVGIIFIEIALGLHKLALIHICANACLRAYQLLVSPSVVSHLLHFSAQESSGLLQRSKSRSRLIRSLYVFCLNEGYGPDLWQHALMQRLGRVSRALGRAGLKAERLVLAGAVFSMSTFTLSYFNQLQSHEAQLISGSIALFLGLAASTTLFDDQQRNVVLGWNTLFIIQALIATSFDNANEALHVSSYPFTLIYVWLAGLFLLKNQLIIAHLSVTTRTWALFVLSVALFGFPISPLFYAEDMIIEHALHLHLAFAVATVISLMIGAIGSLLWFNRSFLNPREEAIRPPQNPSHA
jgi:NADH-quinone oxidoreductase subunit L